MAAAAASNGDYQTIYVEMVTEAETYASNLPNKVSDATKNLFPEDGGQMTLEFKPDRAVLTTISPNDGHGGSIVKRVYEFTKAGRKEISKEESESKGPVDSEKHHGACHNIAAEGCNNNGGNNQSCSSGDCTVM